MNRTALNELRTELVRQIEEKHKLVIQIMRTDTFRQMRKEVRESLQLPNLIGENCPHEKFTDFMSYFFDKTEADITILKKNYLGLRDRFTSIETQHEQNEKEKQALDQPVPRDSQSIDLDMEDIKKSING